MANTFLDPQQIKATLVKKVGPLPVWAWGSLILAGLLIWRYRQQQPERELEDSYGYDTTATPAYYDYGPATGSSGAGSAGGSGGFSGAEEDFYEQEYGYGSALSPMPKRRERIGRDERPRRMDRDKNPPRNQRNKGWAKGKVWDSKKHRWVWPVNLSDGDNVSGNKKKQTKDKNKLGKNKKHDKNNKPHHKQKDYAKVSVPYKPPAWGWFNPSKESVPPNAKTNGNANQPHAGVPSKVIDYAPGRKGGTVAPRVIDYAPGRKGGTVQPREFSGRAKAGKR